MSCQGVAEGVAGGYSWFVATENIHGLLKGIFNALKGTPDSVGLSCQGRSLPTHITELKQQPLHYTGYCDASAFGAGGVWFGAKNPVVPCCMESPMDAGYHVGCGLRPQPQG
jgi:hypothetical protein